MNDQRQQFMDARMSVAKSAIGLSTAIVELAKANKAMHDIREEAEPGDKTKALVRAVGRELEDALKILRQTARPVQKARRLLGLPDHP